MSSRSGAAKRGTATRTTLRTRLIVAGAIAAIVAIWGGTKVLGREGAPSAPRAAPRHRTNQGLVEMIRDVRSRSGTIQWTAPPRLDGAVTITGTVIDADSREGVGGVEVVFRSEAGEESTTAAGDGAYRIDLPPGAYRAFVRDETVLSIGMPAHVRLPGLPSADAAGVPDEALMPVVLANEDTAGVDLTVTRGGAVRGKVVDAAGRAIANAVLRARIDGGMRPTLGTDVVESAADGTFELRLPAGEYDLEVSHPRFAGIAGDDAKLVLGRGEIQQRTFVLTAGCVIAGRVVRADGAPSSDGAIERQWGSTDYEFSPSGRIAADGTFRWTTTEETQVVLRAWPWKSPPSKAQAFACRNGARYEQVVFALPNLAPALEGELVDRTGAPVANAYIDLVPMAETQGQQERTDAQGRWSVFALQPGPYRINAYAPGRGVASIEVTSPASRVRLQLGGSGRIEGTARAVANGSFELSFLACTDDAMYFPLSAERRLVTVANGTFTVDDVPACSLMVMASWHGHHRRAAVSVPPGGAGRLELALGPPTMKNVSGTVRDASGRPVEGASVTAFFEDDGMRVATDAAGRYEMRTFAGAGLAAAHVRDGVGRFGSAQTSPSSDDETIDIVLEVEDVEEGEGEGEGEGAGEAQH